MSIVLHSQACHTLFAARWGGWSCRCMISGYCHAHKIPLVEKSLIALTQSTIKSLNQIKFGTVPHIRGRRVVKIILKSRHGPPSNWFKVHIAQTAILKLHQPNLAKMFLSLISWCSMKLGERVVLTIFFSSFFGRKFWKKLLKGDNSLIKIFWKH